jgi:aminoglycoside/choline kinase family phosphotransferase
VIVHPPAAVAASPVDSEQRLADLQRWLTQTLKMDVQAIAPASSDASFRRYFRVRHPGGSLIAMDAPPAHEDCRPFLAIAALLRDIGLNAPEALQVSLEQGYLLLTDLGDRRYLDELSAGTVERLYGDALDALERLQTQGPRGGLPAYDRPMLLREMQLFPDWLLERHLGLSLDAGEQVMLEQSFAVLADAALEQPRVCVHRDYHSRNLMVVDVDNPGILDFQDAVVGPIAYDLVSLLRDCYIAWPREQVEGWALDYLRRPGIRALVGDVADEQWLRWFDLTGVQRHLKASGIFARLWHRDGKAGYLNDVPRTLRYILQAAELHPELAPLHDFLRQRVMPRFAA